MSCFDQYYQPSGTVLDTTAGPHTLSVTALSSDGFYSTTNVTYNVADVQPVSAGSPTRPTSRVGALIDAGDYATNHRQVRIELVWPAGARQVLISNDGGFGAADHVRRFSPRAEVPWTLPSDGGASPRTVHVRFLGAPDDRLTFTDSIVLDETTPAIQQADLIGSGSSASAGRAKAPTFTVWLDATDQISGVSAAQLSPTRSGGKLVILRERSERGIPRFDGILHVNMARQPGYIRVRSAAGTWSKWRQIT